MLRKNRNNKMVTQKTLEKTLESQSKVILEAVSDKFDKVDQKFEKVDQQIKGKFDKVLKGQDKICKQLTDLKQESKASTKLYNRQDKKLENHEQRINKLELNIQPAKHA